MILGNAPLHVMETGSDTMGGGEASTGANAAENASSELQLGTPQPMGMLLVVYQAIRTSDVLTRVGAPKHHVRNTNNTKEDGPEMEGT